MSHNIVISPHSFYFSFFYFIFSVFCDSDLNKNHRGGGNDEFQ